MTIYEIASEAGVSISTVSRVLNNPEKVSISTRKRVENVLAKNSYTPNALARGLVTNSTKTVAILLSDIRNRHFSEAAYTLEKCFFEWGYTTMLCNTGNDDKKKADYIRILSGKQIDGIIMIGSIFENKHIQNALKKYMPNTPVIISNGYIDMNNVYSVSVDHDYGLEVTVDYLLKEKHKDIAFVYSTHTPNSLRKAESFEKAVKKHKNQKIKYEIIASANPTEDPSAFNRQILDVAKDYSAIIFSEDYYALKGINCLKENHYRIPEDIAIIGFDNSVFSTCAVPQLTTIDTKIASMSTIVANTIHDVFSGHPVGKIIMIRPELIVRGST